MKTPNWKNQDLGLHQGFKIILSFESENLDPESHFIDECGWTKEEYKEINNFYWFSAKISAYKGSIECGESYLGCNAYRNLKDVMEYNGDRSIDSILSGYAPQMIQEAIDEALLNLKD